MEIEEFRHWSKEAADWAADYRANLVDMPVRASSKPGAYLQALPSSPPQTGEKFSLIFSDFERLVPPGVTHWQHPRFFAYFPANASLPSVIAEQLTASMGLQCMLWQTSPVATEMEIRMLDWLGQMCGLPRNWEGVIQDSASGATFAAVVTARERALQWQGHATGMANHPVLRFYGSEHCHSSVGKAVFLAGIGMDNLVRIAVDGEGKMDTAALRAQVHADRAAGYLPAGVIACVGSTGTGTSDNLRAVGGVCQEEDLYCHIDAAWAGNAMVCEEHRHLIDGLELADSFVFNPHKWLGANFDLSAHFVKDSSSLVRTLATNPEYLKTQHATGMMPDFCNWSAPLGRRFRALKLWFVIRSFGVEGIRLMIRNHIAWTHMASDILAAHPDFELLAGPNLSLLVFRHRPRHFDTARLNQHNSHLLDAVNAAGFTYVTQTMVGDSYGIRLQVGHTSTTKHNVTEAVDHIITIATELAGHW